MSDTRRAIPGYMLSWPENSFFTKKDVERGHVDIPKRDMFDDDVWGQNRKKHRKKMLSRAARRNNIKITASQLKECA